VAQECHAANFGRFSTAPLNSLTTTLTAVVATLTQTSVINNRCIFEVYIYTTQTNGGLVWIAASRNSTQHKFAFIMMKAKQSMISILLLASLIPCMYSFLAHNTILKDVGPTLIIRSQNGTERPFFFSFSSFLQPQNTSTAPPPRTLAPPFFQQHLRMFIQYR
jgi:hypothetical protein